MKNLLKVLRFFCANPSTLYICAEVSRELAMPERNVNNYLRTLAAEGFLRQEARAYRLSGALFTGGAIAAKNITRSMSQSI